MSCAYPPADEWIPAPPGKYPEPRGAPGAPFADPNLKLAFLDSLRSRGTIDLGTAEDLAMHVLGRYVDLNREGYELLTAVYDFLVRYPLTPAHLVNVAKLHLDPKGSLYDRATRLDVADRRIGKRWHWGYPLRGCHSIPPKYPQPCVAAHG